MIMGFEDISYCIWWGFFPANSTPKIEICLSILEYFNLFLRGKKTTTKNILCCDLSLDIHYKAVLLNEG